MWMGTPWGSFSRARERPNGPPPLRSAEQPAGLPHLQAERPWDHAKVLLGNCLMTFSVSILKLCRRYQIPAVLENPDSARTWDYPPIANIGSGFRTFKTDYCRFGKPWRKRIRFLSCCIGLSHASRMCRGKVCSRTGLPHLSLEGKDSNGHFYTSLAEPYPKDLSRALVRCFRDALVSKNVNHDSQFIA